MTRRDLRTRHRFMAHETRRALSSRYVDGRIYVAGAVLVATSAVAVAPLLPWIVGAVRVIMGAAI